MSLIKKEMCLFQIWTELEIDKSFMLENLSVSSQRRDCKEYKIDC